MEATCAAVKTKISSRVNVSISAAYFPVFDVFKRTPEPLREERNRDNIKGVFDEEFLALILHTDENDEAPAQILNGSIAAHS